MNLPEDLGDEDPFNFNSTDDLVNSTSSTSLFDGGAGVGAGGQDVVGPIPPNVFGPTIFDESDDYFNTTTTYSSLTDGQEMAAALVPILPAVLSILASSVLIRLILRQEGGLRGSPYRRILFLLSCYDILNSINVPLQSFLVPKDSSRRIWAIGNDQTCAAAGFLFQASYPSSLYFCALSFYYILTIRFGMKDEAFARKIEPLFHVVILGFPTITAMIGVANDMYGEVNVGAGCWLAVNKDCDEECLASREWIFGGLIFFIAWICLMVNNLWVYCHVRSTVQRSRRRNSMYFERHDHPSTRLEIGGTKSEPPRAQTPPRRQERDPQAERVHSVGVQALLYVIVFILTYIWTIILRLLSNSGGDPSQEADVFSIMILRGIFLPAMGVGTLLVYCRPRLLRCQSLHPNKSRYWVLSQVLSGTEWEKSGRNRRGSAEQQRNQSNSNSKNSGSGAPGDNTEQQSESQSQESGGIFPTFSGFFAKLRSPTKSSSSPQQEMTDVVEVEGAVSNLEEPPLFNGDSDEEKCPPGVLSTKEGPPAENQTMLDVNDDV
jgi:hypothetical protein